MEKTEPAKPPRVTLPSSNASTSRIDDEKEADEEAQALAGFF
jgi:hypothetical protein